MSALLITLGAILLIAAVAGFVVVPEHTPTSVLVNPNCGGPFPRPCHYIITGASQTVYDALLIATRALLIVGALLVIVGLINYARRPRPTERVR